MLDTENDTQGPHQSMCICLLFFVQAFRGPAFFFFKKSSDRFDRMLCYVLYELHFLMFACIFIACKAGDSIYGVAQLCFLLEIFDGLCVGRAKHEDVIQFQQRAEGDNAFSPRSFET